MTTTTPTIVTGSALAHKCCQVPCSGELVPGGTGCTLPATCCYEWMGGDGSLQRGVAAVVEH
eukprot:8421936-Prorocentrum_lima.AAC.1